MSEGQKPDGVDKEPTQIDPLEVCGTLVKERRFYKAFTSWFSFTSAQQEDAWRRTIEGLEKSGKSYRNHRRDAEAASPGQGFLLRTLPLLRLPEAAKIFKLDEEGKRPELEEDEFKKIYNDFDHEQKLLDVYDELGKDWAEIDYVFDLDDFDPPYRIIKKNFTLEDMRNFLHDVIPRIHLEVYEEDPERTKFPYPWNLLITDDKYRDLLLDPYLRPYTERDFRIWEG